MTFRMNFVFRIYFFRRKIRSFRTIFRMRRKFRMADRMTAAHYINMRHRRKDFELRLSSHKIVHM